MLESFQKEWYNAGDIIHRSKAQRHEMRQRGAIERGARHL